VVSWTKGRRKSDFHSIRDQHLIAYAEFVVEVDDVEIAHMDAARALRLAQTIFVMRAVYIYVPVVCIDVATAIDAGFESIEPEDPAGDEIGLLFGIGKFREVATRGNAALEDHAGGLPGADPFGDLMQAARRAEGIFDIRWRA